MYCFFLKKHSLILMVFVYVTSSNFDNVCVDINDILSSKWMPATLLENVGDTDFNHNIFNTSGSADNMTTGRSKVSDGSIRKALDTMTFHRSMMNQYRCRNYIASQILKEMTRTSFKRRMSDMEDENPKGTSNIMLDQGSSSYEEWLRKSATLDDIYRHHNKINSLSEPGINLDKIEFNENDKSSISTKFDQDYHSLSDHIYEGGYHSHEPHVHPSHTESEKSYKSEKLADIFELALTALAYLSFGMFIVHLIMSISAVASNVTSTISTRIVAVNYGPAALNAESHEFDNILTEPTIGSEEDRFRSIKDRKSTKPGEESNNLILNELAKKIVRVFDSALIADKDNGRCLRNSLCNAAKFSRFVNGKSKLFLTLWSFGVSWLSENLSNKTITRTEGLQTILLGLGKADCEAVYKRCQLPMFKT